MLLLTIGLIVYVTNVVSARKTFSRHTLSAGSASKQKGYSKLSGSAGKDRSAIQESKEMDEEEKQRLLSEQNVTQAAVSVEESV